MVRTQTDVDYVGDRVVVEPIDVPLGTTYEQLLEMIYSVTNINKEHFRLILSFELFVEQVPIDLQMNSPIGNYIPLLLGENDGTSNVQNPFTFEHRLEDDEEDEKEDNVMMIVGADDVHNDDNQDREDDSIELSPMQYHLAPSPQFENVENIGHVVSSEWTPWGNTLMGHPIGEFIVGQIFNSKGDLQHVVKMYSINSHQEYISRCPWRFRAMVVKGTFYLRSTNIVANTHHQ
ncbi:hypothetical protein AAG906_038670 [Vitis piasezkii]